MTLPTNIATALETLSADFSAATPLASAGSVSVRSLQRQAAAAVDLIEQAIATSTLPAIPDDDIAAGVSAYYTAVLAQVSLAGARGYVGRVASNLDQVTA